jgi:hypothetical protein
VAKMEPDHIEAEMGSWPEYRKYVVVQLKETAESIGIVREAISEQKLKLATLDSHLVNILNGNVEKRLTAIESTLSWAKGIGAVFGLAWSVFLIWVSKFLR